MNARTNAKQILDAALAARGMASLEVKCPCCGDELHAEDFAAPGFFAHADALVARYGAMPCAICADDHVTCEACGGAFLPDEMADECTCANCAGGMAQISASQAEHVRSETFGWEQV